MTALKIIGVILLIFLLISFLRIGAIASFDGALTVKLRIGAVKLTVLPKKARKPRKEKKERAPKEEKAEVEAPKKEKPKLPKLSFDEILDLVGTAFAALGATVRRACRRLRIDPLDMTVVFGGDDPSAVARAYGYANAAMWAVMPKAEETFYIPDPSLHLRADMSGEPTAASGTVGLSLRVCDLFAILFALAIPLAKWFLRWKKAHKNDSPKHKGAQPEAEPSDQKNDDTEERIA